MLVVGNGGREAKVEMGSEAVGGVGEVVSLSCALGRGGHCVRY